MKVLVSSLEDSEYKNEEHVSDLYYDQENNYFWMRCVMGDDWFQRITSDFSFTPTIVQESENCAFIVFDTVNECEEFRAWLYDAEKKVQDGFKTMRG